MDVQLCHGALMHDRWIVTAASCLSPYNSLPIENPKSWISSTPGVGYGRGRYPQFNKPGISTRQFYTRAILFSHQNLSGSHVSSTQIRQFQKRKKTLKNNFIQSHAPSEDGFVWNRRMLLNRQEGPCVEMRGIVTRVENYGIENLPRFQSLPVANPCQRLHMVGLEMIIPQCLLEELGEKKIF